MSLGSDLTGTESAATSAMNAWNAYQEAPTQVNLAALLTAGQGFVVSLTTAIQNNQLLGTGAAALGVMSSLQATALDLVQIRKR